MNAPKEPDGNSGDDECIAVEQSIGFCGHISAEILKKEFLLSCELFSFGHFAKNH